MQKATELINNKAQLQCCAAVNGATSFRGTPCPGAPATTVATVMSGRRTLAGLMSGPHGRLDSEGAYTKYHL